MQKAPSQGFTLIELAIVIAVIAILAAVAIPRLGNVSASAERAVILDMATQLTSAGSLYTAEQHAAPQSFTDFVADAGQAVAPKVISLQGFNTKNRQCTASTTTITCNNNAFKHYQNVTFNWNRGTVTVTGTSIANAPPLK